MINIAVIGAGHWGPNLIRNFHNRQTSQVVLVVDRNEDRLAHVRKAHDGIEVSSDAREAFGNDTVDAVVVATPTSTHFELVKASLEAGKHVLVEKPLTANVSEAEELCALADESGLVLMVGHVFVYNAAVRRVKKFIDEGRLGRLFYMSMVRTNLGPIRMDVNVAWDLAAHDVSISNYWLDGTPTHVSAVGGTWINEQNEDAVFVTLCYPNDVIANLHCSWLNPRKARDITVVGDRQMLTFDDMNLAEPIRIYDRQVTDERVTPAFVDTFSSFRASVREGDISIPKVNMGEPLKSECEHFLECVRDGGKPLTDGRDGLEVVRVLRAIEMSIRNAGNSQEIGG